MLLKRTLLFILLVPFVLAQLPSTLYDVHYISDELEVVKMVQTGDIYLVHLGTKAFYHGLYALPPYYKYPHYLVLPVWIIPKVSTSVLCGSTIEFNAPRIKGECPEYVDCSTCVVKGCRVIIKKPCSLLRDGIIQVNLFYKEEVPLTIDILYSNRSIIVYYRAGTWLDIDGITLSGTKVDIKGVHCFVPVEESVLMNCTYPIRYLGEVYYHGRYSSTCEKSRYTHKLCIVDGIIIYDGVLRVSPLLFGQKGVLYMGEEVPVSTIDRVILKGKYFYYKYIKANAVLQMIDLYFKLVEEVIRLAVKIGTKQANTFDVLKFVGLTIFVLLPWIVLYFVLRTVGMVLSPFIYLLKIIGKVISKIPWYVWLIIILLVIVFFLM